MSKRLRIVFYILLGLYIISILSNLHSIYYFSQRNGFMNTLKDGNILFEISILIMTLMMFNKIKIALPISFLLMLYWLVTIPIFGIQRKGLGAIIYIYNTFAQGSYQGFCLFLTAWLIPIVSLVGCIYWYLDIKKSKSLDKHWSE